MEQNEEEYKRQPTAAVAETLSPSRSVKRGREGGAPVRRNVCRAWVPGAVRSRRKLHYYIS